MASRANVTVQRMIVHKVDHKNYDEPLLSDLESPITDDVGSFLRQHIVSNREHKRARVARFAEPSADVKAVRTFCDTVLADPSSFVQQTQRIAELLFRSMVGDNRISAGDLVVCTFFEGTDKGLEWLALLKMDPEDGFVGEREQVNGQTRIVLRRVPEILPTGELQKCAFIVPPDLRKAKGHDLVVLDQQAASYGMRRPVASFFLKDFLKCEVGFERKEQTSTFIYQSQAWVTQKEDTWPTEDVALFMERTVEAVRAPIVDVAAFAQEVIQDPDEQEQYLAHMKREGLRELTFEPDPEERERWTRYTWFRGDDDLQLRIRSEAIGEGKTLHWRLDEATNTYVVTISTANWESFLKKG